ncbi:recombinase family protein [Gimesia sp.]|uniref:recombinase family protein n=1 Tax=Gimesia sp. TaxID=2024833 RepID=UPI003A8FE5F9
MTEPENAIVYYRMSSDQQDDSIAKQRAAIQRVIEQFNYKIVAEYSDEGLSGSKETHKRKAYLQMISDIKNDDINGASVLLLWKLSRFSRENPLDSAGFYRVLKEANVDIHDSSQGRKNLNKRDDRMLTLFQAEQDHAYSLEVSYNSTGGRRIIVEQGWWVAGSIPYGFDKIYVSKEGEESGPFRRRDRTVQKRRGWRCKLAIFEEEAVWVRHVFDSYANKEMSLRKIARHLNEQGVLVPSGSPDKGWTKDNLRDMLRNKAYCGYTSIGHHRRMRSKTAFNRIGQVSIKSDHIPEIVSEKIWDRANHLLNKKAKKPQLHVRTGENTWRGVCYCGHCGYALDRKTRKATGNRRGFSPGEKYTYFSCFTSVKQPGKHTCHQWRILEGEIEEVVLAHLVHEIDIRIISALETEAKEQSPSIQNQDAKLRKRLSELDKLIDTATHRWFKAPEDLADVAERKLRQYKDEAKNLEDQIEALLLKQTDIETLQREWKKRKEEFFEIDERITTTDCQQGGMFPQRMKRVRAKIEKNRLSVFLREIGFRVYFYWKPIVSNPKRVRHKSRKTNYVVDRAKIESKINAPTNQRSSVDQEGGSYQ